MAITERGEARAFDPEQPFSRAQARAAGIGLKTLLSSRFHKVFYDCYVSSTVPLTTRLRAKAALGISPPGTFMAVRPPRPIWEITSNAPDVHVTVPGAAGRTSPPGCEGSRQHERYGCDPFPQPACYHP